MAKQNQKQDEKQDENQNQKQDEKKLQERKPIIETKISKSKDGKWVIHKTIIVDIKPVAYLREVIKEQTE